MGLGENIKYQRQRLGVTQVKLAEEIGVAQSLIANLESRRATNSKYAPVIAKALKVSVDWLLADNNLEKSRQIELYPKSSNEELLRLIDRFFSLFKTHEIAQFDLKNLFDGRLALSSLLSTASLVDALDAETIDFIVEIFHVERPWLLGVSDDIYRRQRWNQTEVRDICQRITNLKKKGHDVEVYFVSDKQVTTETFADGRAKEGQLRLGIVLEVKKNLNGVIFRTYDIWDVCDWSHFSSRIALKTVILFCVKSGIDNNTRNLKEADFNILYNYQTLAYSFFSKIITYTWYPDDLLTRKDVNPEPDEVTFVRQEFDKLELYELVASVPKYL